MKQKLFFILLIIFTVKSFSQDSKISFELNYPIPADNNFVGENYNGVIDMGIDYKFVDLSSINIGTSMNMGVISSNSNLNLSYPNQKINSYLIQPRIFGEMNLAGIEKLHPSLGLGYTFMIFKAKDINDISTIPSNTDSGFNFNFGIAYDVSDSFFVQIQYDFIKLNENDELLNSTYNTNVNLVKIGLGYRL